MSTATVPSSVQPHGAKPQAFHPVPAAFVVNGRFRMQRVTGVQRYAHEIVARLGSSVQVVSPRSAKGAVGHLWEQTVLPWCCSGRLLWNPNACGPLSYARQIVTFHDLFPLEHPEWYSTAYARWYRIVMRQLAREAVHLIAVSEYTKARLVELLGRPADEITVIPNGCHLTGPAGEVKVAAAAAALKLPGRRYVLSLSSQEQRKNVGALLEAWAAIHHQLPQDLWLVLAGPKADEAVYGQQSKNMDLPRVFFTGYVPEEHLAGLYSGASLFAFPSIAEGFGLPLLEAMACGVRCVASSTSSIPEVGGDAVDYIDPHNVADLAQTLMRLLQTPTARGVYRPSLEQAGRFTWDEAASKTLRVLQTSAMKQRQPPVRVAERLAH